MSVACQHTVVLAHQWKYNDKLYDFSQVDCGLLGGNMVLSAWSMGIGSCCLGSPIRFMQTGPEAAGYLKRLNIPEGYQLEKPRDFDPFGQTGLSPLATI